MHEHEGLADNCLQQPRKLSQKNGTGRRWVCGVERETMQLTPPGMNEPDMTAPSGGTTRGWAIALGNMRRPSLITAVCEDVPSVVFFGLRPPHRSRDRMFDVTYKVGQLFQGLISRDVF